jgi:predicted nucleic acid-binding protein
MVIPLRIKGAFEMNGKRYLLDTNAFIQLLSGNGSVRTIIDDADFLSTSVIC